MVFFFLFYRIRQVPLLFVGAMRSYLHELRHIGERRVFCVTVGTMRLQLELRRQGAFERRTIVG